jgi:hypothetical protein
MIEAQTRVSVEQYLSPAYPPDRDYVDGEAPQRNLDEIDHGSTQAAVAFFVRTEGLEHLRDNGNACPSKAFPLSAPEIAVVRGAASGSILTEPPFVSIKILLPEDRGSRVRARIKDFLEMGVPYIGGLDPQEKTALLETSAEGLREVKDGNLRTRKPTFEVAPGEFFS